MSYGWWWGVSVCELFIGTHMGGVCCTLKTKNNLCVFTMFEATTTSEDTCRIFRIIFTVFACVGLNLCVD
jgi:hypothetical protein